MVNNLITQGVKFFITKKYTESIQILNKALLEAQDNPKEVNVRFWLGSCYLEQALQTGNMTLFTRARWNFKEQLKLAEKLNGNKGIEQQAYAQYWLGRCYLEQVLQIGNTALFKEAYKHFQAQLALSKQLNGNTGIKQQSKAQSWMGACYFEQALQTNDIALFNKAYKHFQAQLLLGKQLNGDMGIEQQVNAQSWMGACYFEQALQTGNAILFDRAYQHFQEQLIWAEKLKNKNIEQQVNAQSWMGACYFEQALQTGNATLFDKACWHFQEQSTWAEKLKDKNIEQQADAQHWLGRCYFEQALQTSNKALFDKVYKHFEEQLVWAEQLNGDTGIEQQADAQHWLGRCYFEQALQTDNTALFNKARRHFQEQLVWAEQLNSDMGIEQQANAQSWLGRCYLKQAKQNQGNIKQSKDYLSEAEEHFDKVSKLIEKLKNKPFKKQMIIKFARNIRELDFTKGTYEDYFKSKKKHIQQKLSENINSSLKEIIAAVLAVLSIAPIEFDRPLAHYTSPAVCEKLLGIGQKDANQEISASKMRMNSSAYMNDPYEGESLYDLLGIQEPDLENLSESNPYNAFFACFSSRVNDLNQFRLYGKVGNVEASGCCLVFNRRGNWIREPDIDASYRRLNEQGVITGNDMKTAVNAQRQPENLPLFKMEVAKAPRPSENLSLYQVGAAIKAQRPSENLPLYQIAYIFYRDEYTQNDEYDVMDGNPNFGIRLKPISDNHAWHEVRKAQLQTALTGLCEYFKNIKQNREESQENKAALEYIRYLFKDYAFRDEEEFRLLQIEEIGSDKVQYCPDTNTAFLEYGNVCTKLDEVILGTNYERTTDCRKVEVFRHLLKRKQPHIKVRHSSLPINPPNKP